MHTDISRTVAHVFFLFYRGIKEQLEKELAEAKTLQLELEKVLKDKIEALKAPAPKVVAAPSPSPQRVTTASAAPAKDVEIISSARNLAQNVSQAFFAAPSLGATEKKSNLKEETARASNGEDWSNLSLSILKQKTVKDLVEYLESKVSPGDESSRLP